ncbi:MAG: flagellar biosynthetic protein FliR [Magnetococcus sp. DMHC-6]
MDPQALMDFLGLSVGEVERTILILSRLSGLFLSAPFFSRTTGPMQVRAALIFTITFVLFPLVSPWEGEGDGEIGAMMFTALTEVLIGAIMGLLFHWALISVQLAGSVIGFQMGLSIAQVMDPTSGVQENVLSNLYYLATLTIFLIIDGHYLLLEGLAKSFQVWPLGHGLPKGEPLLQMATTTVSHFFVLGLMMAAPVVAATTLLYIGMGLINRASPQIQVFFLGMPLAQMIGFIIMGMTMTAFGEIIVREFDVFYHMAFGVFQR